MGHRQGSAHFLFQVTDRAQGDRHAQDRLDKFLDAPPAGVQDAAKKRQRGTQARTTDLVADLVGNRGPIEIPTVGTGAGMRLVLGHLYREGGNSTT